MKSYSLENSLRESIFREDLFYTIASRSTRGLHKIEVEPSQYSYHYGDDGSHYVVVEWHQKDGYGYGYHKREAEQPVGREDAVRGEKQASSL